MSTKTIKVIKRKQQARNPVVRKAVVPQKNTKETARDMVATLTGWVQEFQQKRREEAQEAFRKLFVEPNDCANC